MIRKILIANRGEIAVRIIRACKEMGIATVAVFSEADKDALHVQLADEAVCIGSARSKDSYLNAENILSAAYLKKADAIHPGFGFLSENASFALKCKDCNIKFIGPDADIIDIMGNKSNARDLMIKAGVPVIPGSDGTLSDLDDAKEWANKIGYPVMIKASAGGGGKGIRKIYTETDLIAQFDNAKNEAKANFGDDSMYMEKIVENAKHIEIQILGDEYGNIIHLGERDCSMQRRNQKLVEEAPSPVISEQMRNMIGKAAVKAARFANYKNAGTIEFLYDKNGNFYFMEMNTRIQVEHPVTEMITDIDIVKWQIKIASGIRLTVRQEDVKISGHSIECRINAENVANNFAPSPGKIDYLFVPGGTNGIRIDSAIYAGYTIPPYYDSMVAKLIVRGKDRTEAMAKMRSALTEFVVNGIDTNIDFQLEIMNTPEFINGEYTTEFVEKTLLAKY
ncbi:MAG: acetyl-CoA carboxylase biotin carboxylase subunit [Defluviitaleaceae bacterium]|nr:acetyl-CoA carboxylase biotin carboxylase subunit [Defluviitaleaceae bacterium]